MRNFISLYGGYYLYDKEVLRDMVLFIRVFFHSLYLEIGDTWEEFFLGLDFDLKQVLGGVRQTFIEEIKEKSIFIIYFFYFLFNNLQSS